MGFTNKPDATYNTIMTNRQISTWILIYYWD